MKTIFFLLLSVAFAQSKNTQLGCYRAMDRSGVKKPGDGASSEAAWNVLLEDQIKKAQHKCNPEEKTYGDCLGEFVDSLRACEGVGDKDLQIYVQDMRKTALAHATHNSKPTSMVNSSDAGR